MIVLDPPHHCVHEGEEALEPQALDVRDTISLGLGHKLLPLWDQAMKASQWAQSPARGLQRSMFRSNMEGVICYEAGAGKPIKIVKIHL